MVMRLICRSVPLHCSVLEEKFINLTLATPTSSKNAYDDIPRCIWTSTNQNKTLLHYSRCWTPKFLKSTSLLHCNIKIGTYLFVGIGKPVKFSCINQIIIWEDENYYFSKVMWAWNIFKPVPMRNHIFISSFVIAQRTLSRIDARNKTDIALCKKDSEFFSKQSILQGSL